MVSNGKQWYLMVSNGKWWYAMVSNGKQWSLRYLLSLQVFSLTPFQRRSAKDYITSYKRRLKTSASQKLEDFNHIKLEKKTTL